MYTYIEKPYANAILVKLIRSGNYLHLSTVDHIHKASPLFYIQVNTLTSWLTFSPDKPFYDFDILHTLRMYRLRDDRIEIRVTWLHECGTSGSVRGYTQVFIVSKDLLLRAVTHGRAKGLIDPETTHREVRFTSGAHYKIAVITRNPLLKRALSKALRDSFKYPGDTVTLTADFRNDFFFSATGISGGLCCHQSVVCGHDGKTYPCFRYSVHT